MISPEDLIRVAARIIKQANAGQVGRASLVRFAGEATLTAKALIDKEKSPIAPEVDDFKDMETMLKARTSQVDELRKRLGRVEGAAKAVVFEGAALDLLVQALADSSNDSEGYLPRERKSPYTGKGS